MKLLVRLLRFLARLVFIALFHLLAALVRFIVFPVLQALLRVFLFLMSMAFTAAANGPRQYIDRRASEWTLWLINLGIDRKYLDEIYSLCRLMVGSLVFLGWIVATLFTVAILRIVFVFFI